MEDRVLEQNAAQVAGASPPSTECRGKSSKCLWARFRSYATEQISCCLPKPSRPPTIITDDKVSNWTTTKFEVDYRLQRNRSVLCLGPKNRRRYPVLPAHAHPTLSPGGFRLSFQLKWQGNVMSPFVENTSGAHRGNRRAEPNQPAASQPRPVRGGGRAHGRNVGSRFCRSRFNNLRLRAFRLFVISNHDSSATYENRCDWND